MSQESKSKQRQGINNSCLCLFSIVSNCCFPYNGINNSCLCLFSIVSNCCFPYNGINDSCAVVGCCATSLNLYLFYGILLIEKYILIGWTNTSLIPRNLFPGWETLV